MLRKIRIGNRVKIIDKESGYFDLKGYVDAIIDGGKKYIVKIDGYERLFPKFIREQIRKLFLGLF